MKLATSAVPVEVSGGSTTSSFSIAMNGKAFRVLSDTLYQNKIGSIVREISCNAYDAHVMAGKPDLPFVIHLPDAFEPWFSVQDFGVGLSPEDITNVFTVYFQSTKDNSNDAVGAFGLGAKTPFSYTDQFTVTSVKDGMRRIYSAFITESGVPSIIEMDASPTDDVNGVEIKLSVKREDYNKFASEVASQLKFFKVKPVIKNRSTFAFENVSDNLVIDSANVAISNDKPAYGQPWAHVIQRNVGYPLDINQVKEKISADNRRLLDSLSGSQVRFYFNIGEIGVTASREGVEYNEHTIANIEAKLTAVRAELTAYINSKLASQKTAWDKALFLNSSPAINRLARGADITIPNVKRNNSGYYYFDFTDMLLDHNKKDGYGRATTIGITKMWYPGKAARESCQPTIQPGSGENIVIVLRDTANKPNIRAKHYLSQLGSNYRLLEIDMFIDGAFDDKFIKRLSDMLGGFNAIKRLSEIEPPAREVIGADGKTVRASYTRPTYYSHIKNSGFNIRSWKREFDGLDENDEDTAYIVIKNMEPLNRADCELVCKYEKLIEIVDNALPLVGIREADLKKIEGMANYVKLADYVEQAAKRIENNKKLYVKWRHAIIGCIVYNTISGHLMQDSVIKALEGVAPNAKPTKLLKLGKRLNDMLAASDSKLEKIALFMGWDASKVVTPARQRRAKDCYNKVMERYPLLRVYSDWQVRQVIPVEHLAKYVSVM